jgi:hypothetical protein
MAPDSSTWRIVGASVAGTAHARAGTSCQDAHRWELLPNGCLIVAVADGAGSASRSDEGARTAADTAVSSLAAVVRDGIPADEQGWHEAIVAAFEAAAAALATTAEAAGASIRDYATTLMLAVATPNALVVGQIGDGIVVAEDEGGALFLAAMPQRGEYANEVALLTMLDAIERLATSHFPVGVRAFAATTDGLLRLALRLPVYEPHAPFFAPLFAFAAEATDAEAAVAELVTFLASERVAHRTDDDKTLVIAVRVDEQSTPDAAPDAAPGG